MFFFIELKGSDFHSGFKQLFKTIQELESNFTDKTLKARLILSKVTDIRILKKDASYIKLAKKLRYIPYKNDNILFRNNEITDKL